MQRTLTLLRTVYTLDQLEVPELAGVPQVALAGRSNVGKSTLVNSLAGRKALAKVSATPGKTKSLNFYRVDPGGWLLVDLPGYGYARESKSERQKWARLIETYLRGARALQAVAVLLDSRLQPQAIDLDLTSYLRGLGVPTLAVLTKADKCGVKDRAARSNEWSRILGGAAPVVFSAKTGLGREALWTRLEALAMGSGDQRPDLASPENQASRSQAPEANMPLASQEASSGGSSPFSPVDDPSMNKAK